MYPGPRKLILVYHTFCSEDESLSRGYVSTQRAMPVWRLREQLEWLSGFADFVPLQEIMERKATDRWKVAVTLDDGYYNNLSMGLPVFEAHQVPVTWFVCTGLVERERHMPWWDLLDFMVETCRSEPVRINVNVPRDFDLSDPVERKSFQQWGRKCFLKGPAEEAAHVREQLKEAAGELPASAFATRDEIIEAARSSWVTLGGHTLTHPNMAQLTTEGLEHEVSESRRILREWTNQSIDWFAYPFGGPEHWNVTAKQVVRDAGFDGAVTTYRAYAGQARDRFEVPRLTMPNTSAVWKARAWVRATNTCRRLFRVKQALGL
jgi:peptidoglycan/xylan/chitin deacetylase (PgdA/CDA1 family)